MRPCAACGFLTLRRLCHFCRCTFDLIQSRQCVSCKAPISEAFDRIEGKCAECLSRKNRLSAGTRWLLKQASAARYNDARRAA